MRDFGHIYKKALFLFKIFSINISVFIFLIIAVELIFFTMLQIKGLLLPGASSNLNLPDKYKINSFSGFGNYVIDHNINEKKIYFNNDLTVGYPVDQETNTITVLEKRRNSFEKISEDSVLVYCFGGSTMWGSGVRDEHTIPGFLNSLKENDKYQFLNFGIPAFGSTQELLKLTNLITSGNIPDKVILYDGALDIVSAQVRIVNKPMDKGRLLSIITALYKLSNSHVVVNGLSQRIKSIKNKSSKSDYKLKAEDKILIEKAIEKYFSNIALIKHLGEIYNFDVYAFFQPFLLSGIEYRNNNLDKFENNTYLSNDLKTLKIIESFYTQVSNLKKDEKWFFDISDIFVKKQIVGNYFDDVHLGPKANKIIAEEIYKNIID